MAFKWVLLLGVALVIAVVHCQETAKEKCKRPVEFDKSKVHAYLKCIKLLVNSRYRKRFDPSKPIYDVLPERAYYDYQPQQPNEDYDQSDIYYNYY